MRLPSPSMAVSLTALTVALGGTGYAATKLDANSVGSREVKRNSLTASDIRNGTISSSDVKNNALTSADIRNGSLRAGDFGPGSLPRGATGAQGPKGDTGAQGPAGAGRWALVNRAGVIEAQSGGFRIANAYPAGSPGEGNVYIDSGDADLTNNGIVATIALENAYSLKGPGGPAVDNAVDGSRVNGRNTGADLNPEFSGEITATRCNIPGAVTCAPADTVANGGDGASTNRNRYLVVSPRNSDGTVTVNDSAPGAGDNTHKRFYVIVTGPLG